MDLRATAAVIVMDRPAAWAVTVSVPVLAAVSAGARVAVASAACRGNAANGVDAAEAGGGCSIRASFASSCSS